jgi:hypothetical protein
MNAPAAHPHAVPPRLKSARAASPTFFISTLLLLVVMGIGLVVYCFDPTKTWFFPTCAFHRLTGLNCPGCGATRSLYALLHGRWQLALRDNALFILTGIALAARAGWIGGRKLLQLGPVTFVPTNVIFGWLVLGLIFGLVRNFPAFAFLSPAN